MIRSIAARLFLAGALLALPAAARAADPAGGSWARDETEASSGAEASGETVPDDEPTFAGDSAPDAAAASEPYQYPQGPEEPTAYPTGWVRGPAVAADLLLVRPAMVVGLAAGAVAFVATLPITAPTLTTDDAAHALFDQTLSALSRPLGEF